MTKKYQSMKITKAHIEKAQKEWIAGLVHIGQSIKKGGNGKPETEAFITKFYDYDNGKVLFKPTLAIGKQTFRPTKEGAISYFLAGNPNYPNDIGFALLIFEEGYTEMLDEIILGENAIVMCKMHLTAKDGSIKSVDKTFAYRLTKDGDLKIIAHHSSLLYNPWFKYLRKFMS